MGTTVRNQLDSSAPSRRRGKEREGGKKKKKTLMKKIILADREKRKLARKEAEERRTERIAAGIKLKPLEIKEEESELIVHPLESQSLMVEETTTQLEDQFEE